MNHIPENLTLLANWSVAALIMSYSPKAGLHGVMAYKRFAVFICTAVLAGSLLLHSVAGEDASGAEPLKPLYFMYITSFGESFNSSGTIPAVDLAVEAVNADPTLLPGYELRYNGPFDSKVGV